MVKIKIVWVLIAALLAGCTETAPDGASQPNSPDASSGEDGDTWNPESPGRGETWIPGLNELDLNDCKVLDIGFRWPSGSNPSMPPSHWTASDSFFGTKTFYEPMSCERVSWNGLERPAELVFELTNNFEDAFNCTVGDSSLEIVKAVYINDQDLVAALQSQAYWPVFYADVEFATSEVGGVFEAQAQWRVPGHNLSGVTYRETGPPGTSPRFDSVWVWETPLGVSAMDVVWQVEYHQIQGWEATVEMSTPMAAHEHPTGSIVADASYGFNYDIATTIRHYGDQKCEQLL